MIIGFAYRARVGKSVSADYLANTYSFINDSFAYSLKQGAKIIFSLSEDQMELTKEIPDDFWGMSPRQILQLMGTEAMRTVFSGDIWVKTLQRRIQQHPTRNHAISDVRFKNEAEAIKAMGGIVIRIDRDKSGTTSKHSSETELDTYDKWDELLDNNGDFNHLFTQLDLIVSKYILSEPPKEKKKRGPKPKKKQQEQ